MAEERAIGSPDIAGEDDLAGVAAELLFACEDGGRRLEIARQESLKVMEAEMQGLDPASLPPVRPLEPCDPEDVAHEANQLLAELERRSSAVSLHSLQTTITPSRQADPPMCGLNPESLPPTREPIPISAASEPMCGLDPSPLPPTQAPIPIAQAASPEQTIEGQVCGLDASSLPPARAPVPTTQESNAHEDPAEYADFAAQLLKDCSASSILAPTPSVPTPRSTPKTTPRGDSTPTFSKEPRYIDPTEVAPEAAALLNQLQTQSVLSLTSSMAPPMEDKPDLLTQLKQKDPPTTEGISGLDPSSLPPSRELVPIAQEPEDPTSYGDLANELLRQCAVSSVLSSVYVAKSPRSVDLTTLKPKEPQPPEQPEEIAPDATLLLGALEAGGQLKVASTSVQSSAEEAAKEEVVPTEPPPPELKPGDAELMGVAEELLRTCEGVGGGAASVLAVEYARKAKRDGRDLDRSPKMERAPTMEEINPMVDNLLKACEGGILAPDENPEPTETAEAPKSPVPNGALKSPDRAGSRSNLDLKWALPSFAKDDPGAQPGPSAGSHALSRSTGPIKKPVQTEAPQAHPPIECRNVTNWWDQVSQPVTSSKERRPQSPKNASPPPSAAPAQAQGDDISQRWQTVIRRSLKGGAEIPGFPPANPPGTIPPIPISQMARRSPCQKPVSEYDLDSYRPIEQGKPLREAFRPPRRRDNRSPGATSAPAKARVGGEARPGYKKANSTGQVQTPSRRSQAMVGKSDSEPTPGDRSSLAPSRSPAPLPAAKEGAISQLLWSYKKDAKYGNQKSLPGSSPRPVYTDVQPPSPRMYGPLQDFYGAHDEPPSAATVEMIKRMARQEEPADAWKSDFQGEKDLKQVAGTLGKWTEEGQYASPRTTLAQAVRANRKAVEKKMREVLGDEMAEPILMNPKLVHDDDFGGYEQIDEMSTPRMKEAEEVADNLMKSYAKYERRMNELEQTLPKAYQSAQPRPYPTNVNIARGPGWRAQSAPKLGNQRPQQQGSKKGKPRPMEELMAALAGTGFAPSKSAGDAPTVPSRTGKSPRRNVPRSNPGSQSTPGHRPLSKRALREKEMDAEIDAHIERMYDEILKTSSQVGNADKSYSTDDAVRDFVRRSFGGRN